MERCGEGWPFWPHVRAALDTGGLPEDRQARDDLPIVVGYPYEEALHDAGTTAEAVSESYREFHVAAVRAVMRYVMGAE